MADTKMYPARCSMASSGEATGDAQSTTEQDAQWLITPEIIAKKIFEIPLKPITGVMNAFQL